MVIAIICQEKQRVAHCGQILGVRAVTTRVDIEHHFGASCRAVTLPQLITEQLVVAFEEQIVAHDGKLIRPSGSANRTLEDHFTTSFLGYSFAAIRK